jgi:chemotaxis protein methyltransferase CheR
VFDRRLKKQVVFADHSLATDAVFSEVHLVSCRNVLIYFNRELQDRAVGLFHDSLVRRGFLGLGAKESLQFGAHAAEFEACSAQQRLYRRTAA